MPRKGQAYSFDQQWVERVWISLKEKGWRITDLAREIKASRTAVSNILDGRRYRGTVRRSVYMLDINRVLGWPPPQPAPQQHQIISLWNQLTVSDQQKLFNQAQGMVNRETARIARAQANTLIIERKALDERILTQLRIGCSYNNVVKLLNVKYKRVLKVAKANGISRKQLSHNNDVSDDAIIAMLRAGHSHAQVMEQLSVKRWRVSELSQKILMWQRGSRH